MEILSGLITSPKDFDLEWTVKAICSHFAVGYLLSLLCYIGWMRLFVPWNREIFNKALLVAFIGALVSVLIDVDHVVLLFGSEYGRPLHIPLAALAVVAIFITFLRLGVVLLDKVFKRGFVENRIEINVKAWIWSLCILVHVIEDYTLGWF